MIDPRRDVEEYLDGARELGAHIRYIVETLVAHLVNAVGNLDLDRQKPVAVACTVGHRAGLGVSHLLKAGFADVRNLLGGMEAWQALDLPTE